jgi:hypothetical protein
MAMRRREPPVPLTIQGPGEKLDQLTAGQANYEDLLRRLADGQQRHAEVLDLHTTKLNELVSGQNAHTELLRELARGQKRQTESLTPRCELSTQPGKAAVIRRSCTSERSSLARWPLLTAFDSVPPLPFCSQNRTQLFVTLPTGNEGPPTAPSAVLGSRPHRRRIR